MRFSYETNDVLEMIWQDRLGTHKQTYTTENRKLPTTILYHVYLSIP